MSFLVGEIAAYLLVATLLGLLIGWLLYRCGCRKSIAELDSKINNMDSQITSYKNDLQTKEQQLLAAHYDIVNLRSTLATTEGNAALMESRWQSTLKQARQAPSQLKWIQSLQHKLAATKTQLNQNRGYAETMATEARNAKENLQRVHTRLTEVDAKNADLKTWISVFQNKFLKSKTEYGQLRNFATAADKSDRANRENLNRVHSRLSEIDGKQQPLRTWIRVFQDKLKHTKTNYGQLRNYATSIQTELDAKRDNLTRAHTRLSHVTRELEHVRLHGDTPMPPIPSKSEVKDNKVLRLVDRIRLLGTSKNEVYGRMNNQLRDVKLDSVQKERKLTDSCEEKDAIIYDLRQQLRKAENRAQKAPAPAPDQSVKVKELEAELARVQNEVRDALNLENQLREHKFTIESYRSKVQNEVRDALNLENQLREHKFTIESYRSKLDAAKNQLYTERLQAPEPANPESAKPAPAKREAKKAPAKNPARSAAKSDVAADRDDLKLIKGVGPKIEQMLNKLGVHTFAQIAQWNKSDIDQMAGKLGSFKDRITRDDWMKKAQKLHKAKYG